MVSPGTQTTAISAFEGLFLKALQADPPFKADLKSAGFDADRAQAHYPTEVWNRCIDVALARTMAGKSREDGLRALGHRLIDGFFQTIVGNVIAVGIPLLGVERVVQRLPRYIGSASIGVELKVEKIGERAYVLRSRDAYALPELTAGMVEAGLERTRTKVQVEVVERSAAGYVLSIRW